MPSAMPISATSPATMGNRRRDFWIAFACLAMVLAALFHRSFQSNMVVFSNDGPLGQINAQAEYALRNLRGYWQDLNWIGIAQLPGFPTIGYSVLMLLGVVGYSKFIAPLSLLILGLSAWFCFRRMGFVPWVCFLGALAAALDMTVFSISCWGLSGWTLQRACTFLVLAALAAPSGQDFVLRLILAGFCVGMGIMEGFDVGAIFSLYVAAFVLFQAWIHDGSPVRKLVTGTGRVVLVAIAAALIAAHALTALVGTQVKGVVGMQQDEQTKKMRWHEATQWSLPPIETLRIFVPGLFGYRMTDVSGRLYEKSYWGAIAEDPMLPELTKASESSDPQIRTQAAVALQRVMRRHTGSGEYAGVAVVFVAIWSLVQSFRRKNNPFNATERKFIWFWSVAACVSLLFAFGRHAPFYQLIYALPYFSTIRNPVKFLYPLHLALVILFGYGLQALWRQYLTGATAKGQSQLAQLKDWWKTAPTADKKWTIGSVIVVIASLFAWLLYASAKPELVKHLQSIGFPDGQLAASMVQQSIGEAGWFILFLVLSAGLITLMLSGGFCGRRVKWAGVALGLLLVADLGRANLPWIVYYDYKEKYATNSLIELLRKKPYEQRVTAELAPRFRKYFVNEKGDFFGPLYYEWLQHNFPYYKIQSLDIIQMPRTLEFDEAYMDAFRPTNASQLAPCGRLWQLTNTRFVLGMTAFLDSLNQQLDPGEHRFRVHNAFNVTPRPGLTTATRFEDLTVVEDPNGQFAVFEFTGALPRAKLFSQWQVSTNDAATLQQLNSTAFNPAQKVLVANALPASIADATNQPAGSVEYAHYEPKRVQLNAIAVAPSVLLLNDRYHPHWTVRVDGKPETLLRCNYVMRGVYVTPGKHVVEFRFEPPATSLYVSLTSIAVGIGLCAFLIVSRKSKTSADSDSCATTLERQPAAVNRKSQ
jgi:hypothetical protein